MTYEDIINWIALVVLLVVWISWRFERRGRIQALITVAALRGRRTLDRTNWESVGRP